MWLTQQERTTLAGLGLLLLIGLALLLWQKPTLTISGGAASGEPAPWDGALAAERQVDVNTATVAELERLPGVGPALGGRIVAYRTAHGPFSDPEELTRVQGIGPKTIAALRDYLAVGE